jgi:hypothetical protein
MQQHANPLGATISDATPYPGHETLPAPCLIQRDLERECVELLGSFDFPLPRSLTPSAPGQPGASLYFKPTHRNPP